MVCTSGISEKAENCMKIYFAMCVWKSQGNRPLCVFTQEWMQITLEAIHACELALKIQWERQMGAPSQS